MNRTIDLPPLLRAADLLPSSIDREARTIDVVWSTGARVRRHPFFGEAFDEELAMDPRAVRLDRLNGGAPLLKVHDASALDSVIGSVEPGTARIAVPFGPNENATDAPMRRPSGRLFSCLEGSDDERKLSAMSRQHAA